MVMRSSLNRVVPPMTAAFLVLLSLSSCASIPIGGGEEPRIIVVRNRTGADIATVTLREEVPGQRVSGFGSLSPVPAGVAQVYVRPTDPPPFPRSVAVEWVDSDGKTHVRELSLAKTLRSSTGGSDEALVFEIWPADEVLVLIEKLPK
jgi:hypothetical protein